MGSRLPLIVVAERQAPMRRAVRRLLGESRFQWLEISNGDELLVRISDAKPALVILEDRLCGVAAPVALAQLRRLGCQAPVILISTVADEVLPGAYPDAAAPTVIIDRLQISSRLPQATQTLLPVLTG
jgi:FixJ family two-component response regulator